MAVIRRKGIQIKFSFLREDAVKGEKAANAIYEMYNFLNFVLNFPKMLLKYAVKNSKLETLEKKDAPKLNSQFFRTYILKHF